MRKGLRPIEDFLRSNRLANKVIAATYSPFSIANVSGGLITGNSWTSRFTHPPHVEMDPSGRTIVTTHNDGPVYLVANGTDRDFKVLGKSSGYPVLDSNAVQINSHFTTADGARAQFILLEFDEKRQRVGEVTTRGSSKIVASLLDETTHVLPAIRLVGTGSVTIDWLVAEPIKIAPTEPSNRITHLAPGTTFSGQPSPLQSVQKDLLMVRNQVDRLVGQLENPTLVNIDNFAAASEGRVRVHSSRDDGPISANRERMVREFLTVLAAGIPDSNGSHHNGQIPATVGIVTDEYMYNFYKDVFENVHYLSPTNYETLLAEVKFDAFLYVTCWKGMHNEEWKGVKFREKPAAALDGILLHAERNEIPTIFQTIEDPSNFEYFLPVAEKFDFVFTSDTDMIPQYVDALGHDNVFYGEYGANPLVNNPIGSFRHNLDKAFFAGSYPDRYVERTADMQMVFDSFPNTAEQLLILDRNFETDSFNFPERHQASIIGPVKHDVLQKIHKLFRYSLNFNSIKHSPTMCAMRVYELQAHGKPLISNYSKSVFNNFPGIRILAHQARLKDFDSSSMVDFELAVANRLLVDLLLTKSSYEVAGNMATLVGLPSAEARSPKILVVLDDPNTLDRVVANQKRVSADAVSRTDLSSGSVHLGEYGYITTLSSDYEYSDYYLASRLAGFTYTNSLFVTQDACYTESGLQPGSIHEYVSRASSPELTLVSTEHPDAIAFITGEMEELHGAGYAADPYGVDYAKYWSQSLNATLKDHRRLTVVVPVHNNGEFLANKCLPSLLRQDAWNEMDILLVDDGSDDAETIEICESLARLLDNVAVHRYDDGGSGSASRPRNWGVANAETELIAFLDPDNEISPGGYDSLIEEYDKARSEGAPVDFVSGYQVKVGENVKFTGRHAEGFSRRVDDPVREFFGVGKFPVVSTQAAVISRDFLRENDITFVENSAGQDTLYGWEVLLSAKSAMFSDSAFLIYYAERTGSVTNQVDLNYFDKSLILERAQVEMLRERGVLDLYLKHRYDHFMENWYLDKLAKVPEELQSQARSRLREIASLYGRTL